MIENANNGCTSRDCYLFESSNCTILTPNPNLKQSDKIQKINDFFSNDKSLFK